MRRARLAWSREPWRQSHGDQRVVSGRTTEGSPRFLLWDIDGTLISAGPDPMAPFRVALARLGWINGAVLDVEIHGRTDLGICLALLGSERDAEDMLARAHELLRETERTTFDQAQMLLGDRTVLPGVSCVLSAAAALGWVNGLATGNSRKRAELKLDMTGIRSVFDWSVSAFGGNAAVRDDVIRQAQALVTRSVTRHGARTLPHQAPTVVIVGDTPIDMAGRRLVDGAIGVATGLYSTRVLQEAGADLVVASLERGYEEVLSFLSKAGLPSGGV